MAAVAAWMAAMLVGYVVNDFLLAEIYEANQGAMRPDAEIDARVPYGVGFMIVGYFAFAYVYAKGYEAGNGVMEGIRFGVLVALLVFCFGIGWQWILFPISATMAVVGIVDAIFEYALYGAIVGAIYRPRTDASPGTSGAM
jgi:hypothetical protein